MVLSSAILGLCSCRPTDITGSPGAKAEAGRAADLHGRLAEAETIVKADQPAAEAEANAAFLKRLLSRKDGARVEADSAKPTAR